MRGLEPLEHLHRHPSRVGEIKSLTSDALPQRRAIQEFHGDEGAPLLDADVLNGADAWVVQRDAARASRSSLDTPRGSAADSADRNLRATGLWRRVSSALKTTPMPPRPSLPRTR